MIRSLLLISTLMLLTACGDGKNTNITTPALPNAAKGESLWKATCLSCHGPIGEGVPSQGPILITSEFVSNSSDKELVEYIKIGRLADDPRSVMNLVMPPKGGNPMLKENDLFDIVAHVRTLQE